MDSSVAQMFKLNSQYLKDISFENPNPIELWNASSSPSVSVNIDVTAAMLDESLYDVSLIINVEAMLEDEKIFIMELTYAGLFTIEGFEEEVLERVVLIDCPNLLFPFARQIVASTAQDGGVGPLLLDPIDFVALYMKKKEQEQGQEI